MDCAYYMMLLADTKSRFLTDEIMQCQFTSLFGEIDSYLAEFIPFWDAMLPEAIAIHTKPPLYPYGHLAGSGTVDFSEALCLYITTRILQPKLIVELGYSGGVSTCYLARGMEMNGAGQIHTVDLSPEYWDTCPMFRNYCHVDTIVPHHTTDAITFLQQTAFVPNLTFTDCSHDYPVVLQIAQLLKQKMPQALHLFHEASMSSRSSEIEHSYVAMSDQIGNMGERAAFEDTFGTTAEYFYLLGSCGIGGCRTINFE